MNTMIIVLVITNSNKQRIQNFASVFAGPAINLILCSANGETWSSVDQFGHVGPPLTDGIPNRADILLMHGGDYDSSLIATVKSQLKNGWTSAFVFNGPGEPPNIEGFNRILRPADVSSFGITKKHAKEIVDYTFPPDDGGCPLPSCCYPTAKHLVALDILAQGFLFTHGLLLIPTVEVAVEDEVWKCRKERTENDDWWLRGLGVKSHQELKEAFTKDHVADADAVEVSEILGKCAQPPDYSKDTDPSQRHPFQPLRTKIAGLLQ